MRQSGSFDAVLFLGVHRVLEYCTLTEDEPGRHW
jgi:hypothetical protein